MNESLTVTREVHIRNRNHGAKQFWSGVEPAIPVGKVPRISRVMALAIHCNDLIESGAITDQSELARFGQITTARSTQIMSLLALAPDIQEDILFLPRTQVGRDAIKENEVRPIAATLDWRKQRRLWADLRERVNPNG